MCRIGTGRCYFFVCVVCGYLPVSGAGVQGRRSVRFAKWVELVVHAGQRVCVADDDEVETVIVNTESR